jgi:gamma-glutamylcyclotransferase (GGCT)/AIG2-like uncharacterized protein YtfP
MRLFVYGTLKRGDCRHHLLAGQQFAGTVRTRPIYRLFNVGEFPAMVRAADGLSVEGELWSVDESRIEALDRAEGCDANLYRREVVELAAPHHDANAVAYLYQRTVQGLPDCGCRW